MRRSCYRSSTLARPAVAAVEFAVMLPLLILLLFGVWEVGRMVEVHQVLTNAAREGGRQASTGVKTVAQITADVNHYMAQFGINTTGVTVTVTNITDSSRPDPAAANQLDEFRMTVTLPVDNFRWTLLPRITSGDNLTTTVDWYSMRDIPITVNATIPLK